MSDKETSFSTQHEETYNNPHKSWTKWYPIGVVSILILVAFVASMATSRIEMSEEPDRVSLEPGHHPVSVEVHTGSDSFVCLTYEAKQFINYDHEASLTAHIQCRNEKDGYEIESVKASYIAYDFQGKKVSTKKNSFIGRRDLVNLRTDDTDMWDVSVYRTEPIERLTVYFDDITFRPSTSDNIVAHPISVSWVNKTMVSDEIEFKLRTLSYEKHERFGEVDFTLEVLNSSRSAIESLRVDFVLRNKDGTHLERIDHLLISGSLVAPGEKLLESVHMDTPREFEDFYIIVTDFKSKDDAAARQYIATHNNN